MKLLKLIILVFCFSINTMTSNTPSDIQYHIKQGDTFMIRSLQLQDLRGWNANSLKESWYNKYFVSFKALKEYPDSTELQAEIVRAISHNSYHHFDTHTGALPFIEEDFSLLNQIGDKYKIVVQSDGNISTSQALNKTALIPFNEKDFDKYISKKSESYYFGKQNFIKDITQGAFPLSYDAKRMEDSIIRKGDTSIPMGYLTKKDSLLFFQPAYWHPKILDANYMNSPCEGPLLFSQKKGRFTKGRYSYETKNIPYHRVEFIDDTIKAAKTTFKLSGTIQNLNARKLSLYILNKYPDSYYFQFDSLEVDESGYFNWTFPLNRACELNFRIGDVEDENSITKQFFFEPGDNVIMNIDANNAQNSWEFSGNNATKFILHEQIKHQINLLQWGTYTSVDHLKTEMLQLQNKLIKETETKNISALSKQHLKASIYFGCYNASLFCNQKGYFTNGYDNNWQNTFLAAADFHTYGSYSSNEMREYIGSFLQYQLNQTTQCCGFKKNQINLFSTNAAKDQFTLAKLIFKDDVLYYALANQIQKMLLNRNNSDAQELVKDFCQMYPKSEIAAYLKNDIGDALRIQKGLAAPNFTSLTPEGKQVNLSNHKGKWVYFKFIDSEADIELQSVKDLGNYFKQLNDKRIKPLLILTDKVITSEKIDSLAKYYSGTILCNPNWQFASTKPYGISSKHASFLINPNGIIESTSYFLPTNVEGYDSYLTESINWLQSYLDLREDDFNTVEFNKSNLVWGVLAFITLTIISLLSVYWWQKRNKAIAQHKREKLDLELKAIRSQLNPHFMFNTLSSIQHLVGDNRNNEASQYIGEFSGLMRQVLHNSNKSMISLNEEIKASRTYLKLESLRFNFFYHIEVDESLDLFNTEVPAMLLQPFIENAVIHGISSLQNKGEIRICIAKNNGVIMCSIDDNGGGYYPVEENMINGQGIKLSQKRFNMIYHASDNHQNIKILNKSDINSKEKGTLVKITLPLDDE
ncbi:histidine kinase [Saccharicrinis aurantiacus]|uniref:histidine kinase n=1 Tax=Saccharicrinis aurantiacus TaxID=1849719 RepID=UPI0009FA0547|nr:histidine kinase [Saccharicrinis aurantiacus]